MIDILLAQLTNFTNCQGYLQTQVSGQQVCLDVYRTQTTLDSSPCPDGFVDSANICVNPELTTPPVPSPRGNLREQRERSNFRNNSRYKK